MEYHPGAIKSMNAWIPAISTAFNTPFKMITV